jgi:molybdate transport system ATP-binding protein
LTVELQDIVLPLADFALEVSVKIDAPSTAVYGPSGSGKTSLLEVIAGLRKPVRGRVMLNGRDQTDADPADRRVGYVPQDDALFPHMSVRRNILYGAREGGPFFLDHVARVLELNPILARAIDGLSGGERKRVALARALLTHPEILLLDEPLTGIDVDLRKRVLDYLVRVREEFPVPIIYVTHQMEEAAVVCDSVVVLERGRVMATRAI